MIITFCLLDVHHLNACWQNYEPRHDKTNNVAVRPTKTQISLGICPVWSEPSLSTWRNLRPLATHWAHSEDSDQTGRMPRLICLRWAHTHFVGFVMRWLINDSPNNDNYLCICFDPYCTLRIVMLLADVLQMHQWGAVSVHSFPQQQNIHQTYKVLFLLISFSGISRKRRQILQRTISRVTSCYSHTANQPTTAN